MLDKETFNLCKRDPQLRDLKIKNIEHAIDQASKWFENQKWVKKN